MRAHVLNVKPKGICNDFLNRSLIAPEILTRIYKQDYIK